MGSSTHLSVGLNHYVDNSCLLNPNVEPFQPHTLTSAHALATPIISGNSDTVDTDCDTVDADSDIVDTYYLQ